MEAVIERERDLFADVGNDRLTPFIYDHQRRRLLRHSFSTVEQRIALELHGHNQRDWQHLQAIPDALKKVTELQPLGTADFDAPQRQPLTLAAEQIEAAALAACAPLTVITGGPGTGKTSIVVTLLRLLQELGIAAGQIGLAAPTGRAAVRMWESIRKGLASLDPAHMPGEFFDHLTEPATLHRMLAWSPARRSFRFNRENPLPYRWLVVDEASMIDLHLTEQLLDAARLDAHLVFLGDADQLPAVEAGAFFRDITLEPPQFTGDAVAKLSERQAMTGIAKSVVQLRTSFRQKGHPGGQHVYRVSQRILLKGGEELGGDHTSGDQIPSHSDSQVLPSWSGVTLLNPQEIEATQFLDWLMSDVYLPHRHLCQKPLSDLDDPRLAEIFQQFNRFRLLCVTRSGDRGVENLNQILQARYSYLEQGMPLMVTRNDYHQGLFNGDLGLLLRFQDDGVWLVFEQEQGFQRFRQNWVGGLEPAFAMTVHKSQGTEAERIALVLADRQSALDRREVIYTALTRAKRGAWIYGDPDLLTAACDRRMERKTTLREHLAGER
jgi:exodeoxyribonuclease V alpha subunit